MRHACSGTSATPTGTLAVPVSDEGTGLALRELDAQTAAMLPRRDTLCYVGCVNVDVTNVIGVNLALALNAASTNTTANAIAAQYLAALH